MLSKQEPKGTRDWFPEEFKIRQYIFDAWRRVCLRYGYEEYLTPLVENAEVYRAKSGEDIAGQELLTFKDLGGRELSIRPEMTPSVTRMISKVYVSTPKPIKYFSIANFMRNEKPQRGRNREFWQLNCDIFGSSSLSSDIEVMQLALDIMLEFKAPQNSFELSINSRNLIDDVLILIGSSKLKSDDKMTVVRTLDKWNKLSQKAIKDRLEGAGLKDQQIKVLESFMKSKTLDELATYLPDITNTQGYKDLIYVIQSLDKLGYGQYINWNPTVIRGFDYYNGLVFEVFDKHPDNNRAMFGGGRYNGLAEIFGEKNFPAVGFAPGDETFKLFLESWNLLAGITTNDNLYYLPLLDDSLLIQTNKLGNKLRQEGLNILSGLEVQKITKALEFADKKKIAKVIIFGSAEEEDGVYKIKDMKLGSELLKKLKL
jgi:histidyl-tRNA synthetase